MNRRALHSCASALCIGILLLICAAPLPAQVITYTSLGTAEITKEGRAQARQQAIDEACMLAVETALHEAIAEEVYPRYTDALQGGVLSQWWRYMEGYEVDNEGVESGYYTVTVKARIIRNKLQAAVDSLEGMHGGGNGFFLAVVDSRGGTGESLARLELPLTLGRRP